MNQVEVTKVFYLYKIHINMRKNRLTYGILLPLNLNIYSRIKLLKKFQLTSKRMIKNFHRMIMKF